LPPTPIQRLILPLPSGELLDLHHTFRCGQIFRWRRQGEAWYGPYGPGTLSVRRLPEEIEVRALGVEVSVGEAVRFLGLDLSLADAYVELSRDPWLDAAVHAVPGLRILRQEPWDCLSGYICSQWNNIPKIELSTERIARQWGRVHCWPEGVEVASFPPPQILAGCSAEELRPSALGYRCSYLVETARRIAGGDVDLQALRAAPYEEALEALLRLPGIGRKVADCILLFSQDQPRAVPVDVWVRRVVHELYPAELRAYLPDADTRLEKALTPREHAAILRFFWDRWGNLAGYAQQYLFHARRLGLIGGNGSR
jgi:N-glycosylase/DNA lyase